MIPLAERVLTCQQQKGNENLLEISSIYIATLCLLYIATLCIVENYIRRRYNLVNKQLSKWIEK